MQAKPHTSLVTALVGVVLALAVAAPASSAAAEPDFPNAVPSQPGALTGPAADTNAARAQERYLTTYGDPTPLAQVSAPADDGGIDWASIGIAVGGTVLLVGAVIALVMRTRRRTGRVHAAA
jgi:hypothetical protein